MINRHHLILPSIQVNARTRSPGIRPGERSRSTLIHKVVFFAFSVFSGRPTRPRSAIDTSVIECVIGQAGGSSAAAARGVICIIIIRHAWRKHEYSTCSQLHTFCGCRGVRKTDQEGLLNWPAVDSWWLNPMLGACQTYRSAQESTRCQLTASTIRDNGN